MFTVFLPVRNGWPYVKECVESILRQTYAQFELQILDNCSSDQTVPWVSSLRDDRVRLTYARSPLSIEESWRRITGFPKRQFMTVIGHDDLLEPDFLALTKALIERHPEASLYQTGTRLINADGKTIRNYRAVPEREEAAHYLAGRLTLQREVSGTGYVMRSEDFENVGGMPMFEKLFYSDDALWLSLMVKSYKAAEPREAVAVRIHPLSESASLPSAWLSMLVSLNQFDAFLAQFVKRDEASRRVRDALGSAFLLNRHQNVYVYALIDACRRRARIDPQAVARIKSSLAISSPENAGKLSRSLKVKLLELLNASSFRGQVVTLWNAYYSMRTRSV
jgi:glycosyltransferase involved in cell wall biosynthesis